MVLDRISIELTNHCAKACWFCYNHSGPEGATQWTEDELVEFVSDCAANGVKAVSFGGGEPLQYDKLYDVLERLKSVLFRSVTTNGLLLDPLVLDRLKDVRPDKVHVSIHFPGSQTEISRVLRNVDDLAEHGIRSGINFLVQRSQLEAAKSAAAYLRQCGIKNDRIVYLPMRGQDTPTPEEMAVVAGNEPFQSMTCLTKCAPSSRFCSIAWDRQVAWCSYTSSRRTLTELTFAGLMNTVDGLGLEFCGGTEPVLQQLG